MTVWDPQQYLKFAGPRLQPAVDLLARVPLEAPSLIYDLGCGAGGVTNLLRARWPDATIIGVDRSPDMLARARTDFADAANDWQEGDIADWRPDSPPDLIFSNAALNWLDDHATLIPRSVRDLAPGGVLAIQMPHNGSAPSHTCITATMEGQPWQPTLAALHRADPVADVGAYFDMLAPVAPEVTIWETEYLHILEGTDPVLEWTRGSVLKPLLDALTGPERAEFLEAYTSCLASAYPRRPDGRTLFPFRRLFIVAPKP